MTDRIKARIIQFKDGTYFNGVKGKLVRKTKSFKDAKIMDKISDRDSNYLRHFDFKLLDVEFYIDIKGEVIE